jgi:hypothetical protein
MKNEMHEEDKFMSFMFLMSNPLPLIPLIPKIW